MGNTCSGVGSTLALQPPHGQPVETTEPGISAYHQFNTRYWINDVTDRTPPKRTDICGESVLRCLFDGRNTVLSKFVRTHYQSSCAIVVENQEGIRKISGSGGFIELGEKRLVVTARHVVDGIRKDALYVRFFCYGINYVRQTIQESHLDVPVNGIKFAKGDIDGAYLYLAQLRDTKLFNSHAQCFVPNSAPKDYSQTGYGQFGMFHFANGRHQVSTGMGVCAHGRINIQIPAGNGASGGMVIEYDPATDTSASVGIAVCRFYYHGHCDNGIIAFSDFVHTKYFNKIIAPNRYENPPRLSNTNLNKPGIECIDWTIYPPTGDSPDAPKLKAYNVMRHHSNHHIIPRRKLLYLWDYFHVENGTERLLPYIPRIPTYEMVRLEKEALRHLQDNLWLDYDEHLENLKEQWFKGHYKKISEILDCLCWPLTPSRNNFAWAQWNLFKGPNSIFRGIFDPGEEVEPVKPMGLDDKLWYFIMEVNDQIDILPSSNNFYIHDSRIESNCRNSLMTLYDYISQQYVRKKSVFQSIKRGEGLIYPYIRSEWHKSGEKQVGGVIQLLWKLNK